MFAILVGLNTGELSKSGGICSQDRCGADVASACGRSCCGVDCLRVGVRGEGGGGGEGDGVGGSRVPLQSSSFSVKSMGNKE